MKSPYVIAGKVATKVTLNNHKGIKSTGMEVIDCMEHNMRELKKTLGQQVLLGKIYYLDDDSSPNGHQVSPFLFACTPQWFHSDRIGPVKRVVLFWKPSFY